ncbi:MAG TPA: ferritin-like protein [Actinomycetes bacterium]|nr:ferritin-like protein [Actinomycetes bacterium]
MEPTSPELGAGTGSPHELVIEGREELLYLLGEAAELEHSIFCAYLYAAFTLKTEPGDGLTAAQVPTVAGWKQEINRIALQEMIHLALVNNLLAALGGAPRLGRHNLPQRSPYAPEIRLTLAPFSEQTLQRFLYVERPEGMDISSIAGELDHDRPAPPVPTGPLVLPAPQAFSSIGELYRGIEWGLRGLVDRYGEERVFVGSPNAQASTRYFRIPERMPELIPVAGLASAVQAIQTIVEEGEGARGGWQRAHFGRFLEILEAYRALKAADPTFAPTRPSVTNPYVRVPRDLLGLATASGPAAPDDPRGVHLIQDPATAAVSDLFNACYAAMLQLLYRFFQHTEETDEELEMLGQTAVLMMLQVLRPLGELLTRLPVGPRAPGWTAGPSFMLTSATPVTPHKPAAWSILGERLLELAEVCGGLTAGAPEVLAEVGERLAAFAAPLLPPDAAGRRPEADVPALAVDPPSGDPAPSFDRDIRPLFTARDRAAMRWSFDLWEVASVRQRAEAILDQVAAGSMPCYGPWSADQVELFRRWVQAGGPD